MIYDECIKILTEKVKRLLRQIIYDNNRGNILTHLSVF